MRHLSKNNFHILIEILSGRFKLKVQLNKFRLTRESECRFCGKLDETPVHLLSNYTALLNSRMQDLLLYPFPSGGLTIPFNSLFVTDCGVSTENNKYPWIVAIYNLDGELTCTGTLITSFHVLTGTYNNISKIKKKVMQL